MSWSLYQKISTRAALEEDAKFSSTLKSIPIVQARHTSPSAYHPPSVEAPYQPIQNKLHDPITFPFKGAQITLLAAFDIEAKVLSTEGYSYDADSDLSPVDFALGWGRMSDDNVLEHLDISQSGRWYRWRTETLPIPRHEIERSSANMHMVPATHKTASLLEEVQKGDVIHIRGYLMRADTADGRVWISSLTRDDTGGGACEIIFVQEIRIKR